MADDAAVALLQEIRDLQIQQVEYLRASVANQHQALASQQEAKERQKLLLEKSSKLWVFVLCSIFVLFFLSGLPWFFKLLLSR